MRSGRGVFLWALVGVFVLCLVLAFCATENGRGSKGQKRSDVGVVPDTALPRTGTYVTT